MAPRKRKTSESNSEAPLSQFPIGNCDVTVEAKNFTCETSPNGVEIRFSRNAKINVAVREEEKTGLDMVLADCENEIREEDKEKEKTGPEMVLSDGKNKSGYLFVLVNPKDTDDCNMKYLQEVLSLYKKELPGMEYAATTGKKSNFLDRCVLNGKFCTLLLKRRSAENPEEVIAAITYQIVPADTQYAEIPLAAVSSVYQLKGIGRLMYSELRKRLQSAGICTILCWGDQSSEGFWLKQGFVTVAEVNNNRRARRLPVKPTVQKALCFPAGSIFMVSHLNKDNLVGALDSSQLNVPSKSHENPALETLEDRILLRDVPDEGTGENNQFYGSESLDPVHGHKDSVCDQMRGAGNMPDAGADVYLKPCSAQGLKRRTWEASVSSLKSKKIKGTHTVHYCSDSNGNVTLEADKDDSGCRECPLEMLENTNSVGVTAEDTIKCTRFDNASGNCSPSNNLLQGPNASENYSPSNKLLHGPVRKEIQSRGECFKIMLMNIANENKKVHLKKVVEDLGGIVTLDGSKSTHIVTGKARKTLNFCTALCTGAWIVSPSWLKESFRGGKFVDEMPYILNDEEYALKYRAELQSAVLRARAKPGSLLKGYDVCIAAHLEPPKETLAAIVMAAGGNVISGLDQVNEVKRTIFVACEEDMVEALSAVKKGIWTFGSDWLINCIMRQELDLEAPQFAESL